ncbi:hypothetical protein [Tessaracoccus sp. Y1736]
MAFDSAAPINRRTVTKGIAWSVPAVAVAGAAPAFATSHCEPILVIDGDLSCKKSGFGSYKLVFKVSGDNCDPGACSGTIYEISENTGGPNAKILWESAVGSPADGATPIVICGEETGDSAAYLVVKATIVCGTTTIEFDEPVKTPQFNSNNGCEDSGFC